MGEEQKEGREEKMGGEERGGERREKRGGRKCTWAGERKVQTKTPAFRSSSGIILKVMQKL